MNNIIIRTSDKTFKELTGHASKQIRHKIELKRHEGR